MPLDLKTLFLCLFFIYRLEIITRARPTNGKLLGLVYALLRRSLLVCSLHIAILSFEIDLFAASLAKFNPILISYWVVSIINEVLEVLMLAY